MEYSIKQATYPFSCPLCGCLVRKGENYAEQDGMMFCMCVLEGRKLTPIQAPPCPSGVPPKGGNNRHGMRSHLERMKFDNLHMRFELEMIARDPESGAAKKIIAKYRRQIKASEERFLSTQN
jgi:hypothetical protein